MISLPAKIEELHLLAKNSEATDERGQSVLTIGGVSPEELLKRLQGRFNVDWRLERMILGPRFTTFREPLQVKLVKASVRSLGFTSSAFYQDVFARAIQCDLHICPAEVGPYLRLVYDNQPMMNEVVIGMEPIPASDGEEHFFAVGNVGIQYIKALWNRNRFDRMFLGTEVVFVSEYCKV